MIKLPYMRRSLIKDQTIKQVFDSLVVIQRSALQHITPSESIGGGAEKFPAALALVLL